METRLGDTLCVLGIVVIIVGIVSLLYTETTSVPLVGPVTIYPFATIGVPLISLGFGLIINVYISERIASEIAGRS